eukprot:m.11824 g.11824  ORF g.11824 m.11824 type:complete len:339 (-) comp4105_c0_seq2:141-1157(-)
MADLTTGTTSPLPTAAIPVWLDCDPGHDDAMAILLAGHSPAVRLLGISTVAGNMPLEATTRNALHVCHIGSLNVRVVPGQAKPLLRPPVHCPEIHGKTGLDPVEFPPLPEGMAPDTSVKAIEAMHDAIVAEKGKAVIVATGSLTNVALLLTVFPEVKEHLSSITLMGGALGVGNTGPVAEFNIQIDPESAKIVFDSGLVTMVPLEVTHTALVTPDVLARIHALDTPFASAVCDLMVFFSSTYRDVFGFDIPPLHDPCAVAYVIAPELFHCKRMKVDIECGSALSAGQTVCDQYNLDRLPDTAKNCNVALSMDVEKFWDLMLRAVEDANASSCLNSKPQ